VSRPKVVLAALVISMLACGAVSASAFAAAQWFVGGLLFSGTESTESKSTGSFKLSATLGTNVKTVVSCSGAKAAGTITENTKDTASPGIELSGCSVLEPSGCTVTSPLKTVSLASSIETVEESKIYDTIEPKSGTEFFKLIISGTLCSVEGSYKLTGSVRCEIPGPAIQATTKDCVSSSTTGSKLKLGSSEAQAEVTLATILSGTNKEDPWAPAAYAL
jgi:hypothetical protein